MNIFPILTYSLSQQIVKTIARSYKEVLIPFTFLCQEFCEEKSRREEAADNLSIGKEHEAKVQLIGCYGNRNFPDGRFR